MSETINIFDYINDKEMSSLQNKEISFIDLCSGIGGGRLGLTNQGYKCLGFSEIDEKAINTYKKFYCTDEDFFGDLMNVTSDKLPTPDLLIAGFPCQSYSIIGQRKGLDDERGQVIFGIMKILKEKNIDYFILENVKGLVNLNNGKELKYILTLLDNLGYQVFYKVLNSLNFGVPQSRERIYFVGISKKLSPCFFNFPDSCTEKLFTLQDILNTEGECLTKESRKFDTLIKYLNNKYNKDKYDLDELLKNDYLVLDTRQSDLRLYNGYVPTLRKGRQGILYIKNQNLYYLSSTEALRLQGFPLEIALKAKNISTTTILQQVGNAMTVNVIEAIAKRLKPIILKNKSVHNNYKKTDNTFLLNNCEINKYDCI